MKRSFSLRMLLVVQLILQLSPNAALLNARSDHQDL
jgi:hypothetical protein